MSEVHNTIMPVEDSTTTEPAFATPAETPAALEAQETAAPETTATATEPLHTEAAPIGDAAAPETAVEEPTTTAEETAVAEPSKAVDSGMLGYKAPGLIKYVCDRPCRTVQIPNPCLGA